MLYTVWIGEVCVGKIWADWPPVIVDEPNEIHLHQPVSIGRLVLTTVPIAANVSQAFRWKG